MQGDPTAKNGGAAQHGQHAAARLAAAHVAANGADPYAAEPDLGRLLADAQIAGRAVFFCGVGGSGMSALAQVLRHRGWAVAGSDRSHDRGENPALFGALAAQGIAMLPQDGSGVSAAATACVVTSTAVEAEIPDLQAATRAGVPIIHRAALLAWLVNAPTTLKAGATPLPNRGAIGVAGTSGKSTVTGMLGHILRVLGADPCVINGGVMVDAVSPPYLGNAICGHGPVVAEVDESDGSILRYHAGIGVINSVTEDHKPLPEIRGLFARFAEQTAGAMVYHAGCPESVALLADHPRAVSFALEAPADWRADDVAPAIGLGMTFTLRGHAVRLAVPGRHNVQNALAAIVAAAAAGHDWRAAADAMASFHGIQRRFEVIGCTPAGITVVDDFGHNPEKIAATLATATAVWPRVLAAFQPHGFGPTRFLRDGLVDAFAAGLRPGDHLWFPPIYDAGGTADRSISSHDLAADLRARNIAVTALDARADLPAAMAAAAQPGDLLLLMGARDPLLPDLARAIFRELG